MCCGLGVDDELPHLLAEGLVVTAIGRGEERLARQGELDGSPGLLGGFLESVGHAQALIGKPLGEEVGGDRHSFSDHGQTGRLADAAQQRRDGERRNTRKDAHMAPESEK